MRRFGLIGEHLGHSLSAPIHRAVWRELGIEADYSLIEIPRDTFTQTAGTLLDELEGFNITIPYKREILPLLAGTDDFAGAIGAVNTVTCRDRIGHNTDAPGFAAMLRHHGLDPQGQPCFILGTGGASAAVEAALRSMGASAVTFVSRRPSEQAIGYADLPEHFSGLLVNCTPAGMWPDIEGCPIPAELLSGVLAKATGVADVIYNPAETRLTAAAKQASVPACTGLYMLVAQAVEAERLWLQRDIPEELTAQIAKEIRI